MDRTRQASLSITISQSLLKLMSIESVMPPNHLFLCRPPVLPPSVFPRIRGFSKEPGLRSRRRTGSSTPCLSNALRAPTGDSTDTSPHRSDPTRPRAHLGNEDHVLPAELLLQLAHQAHLDFLERLQLRDGDEDDDGFPAAANFDLLVSKREESNRRS